jgi:hypothetical protein
MKYFLHDSNAFEDEKISLLFMEFGYEGLGLFYTILEKLAKQEKPIKTEVLKMQLKVGKKLDKCWNFMETIDIISSNNGETFNKQLLNFSEKYKIKKEKNLERISQWRENQAISENVTHYKSVRNTPKEKKSKVKESKLKLFNETEFIDIEIFSQKFIGTQYENANFNYYHEVINNWSSAGGNKKVDWIATARGFMARDMKEGKFVDINFNPNAKRINQDRKLTYAEQQAAIRNSF